MGLFLIILKSKFPLLVPSCYLFGFSLLIPFFMLAHHKKHIPAQVLYYVVLFPAQGVHYRAVPTE